MTKLSVVSLWLLIVWAHPAFGQLANPVEQLDSLKDAKGRLIAYTDGYRVFDANHVALPGEVSEVKPNLKGMLVPVEGSTKRWHLLQQNSDRKIISARVLDLSSKGKVMASTVKAEQFELLGKGKKQMLLLKENGVSKAYALMKPFAQPKRITETAVKKLKSVSVSSVSALVKKQIGQQKQVSQLTSLGREAIPVSSKRAGQISGGNFGSGGMSSGASPIQNLSEGVARSAVSDSRGIKLLKPIKHQAGSWHFGDGGQLVFTNDGPQAEGFSALRQHEGSASYSNEKGELVAYTDGTMLFEASGKQIESHSSSGLGGNISSTQSALFVPVPGSKDQVYLFSQDQGGYAGQSQGLHYSIVGKERQESKFDINRQREKVLLERITVEKLAGVHHANGLDVWILSHRSFSDEFIAFLVSAGGISGPVVSKSGAYHSGHNNGSIGQMKISPDGKWVAVATTGADRVELFQFDTRTGLVSLIKELRLDSSGRRIEAPYGIEFSGSGKFLFVTSWLENAVWRFDIGSPESLFPHEKLAGRAKGLTAGSLQLGPDKNIYVAMTDGPAGPGSHQVGAILSPDSRIVVFSDSTVTLPTKQFCRMGLPNFLASYFAEPRLDFEASPKCSSLPTKFDNWSSYKSSDSIRVEWRWDFGEGETTKDTSSAKSPYYTYSKPGVYSVSLVRVQNGRRDSILKKVVIGEKLSIELGPNQTLPPDGSALKLEVPAKEGTVYVWDDGSNKAYREINSPGLYWVRALIGTCEQTDTIRILPRGPNLASSRSNGNNGAPSIKQTSIEPSVIEEEPLSVQKTDALRYSTIQSSRSSTFFGDLRAYISLAPAVEPIGIREVSGILQTENRLSQETFFYSLFSSVSFQPQLVIRWTPMPNRRK